MLSIKQRLYERLVPHYHPSNELREAFHTSYDISSPGFSTRLVTIFRDPTPQELAEFNPTGRVFLRALINREHVYVWDGGAATHADSDIRLGVAGFLTAVYMWFPTARSKVVYVHSERDDDLEWLLTHPYFTGRKLKVELRTPP